MHRRRLNQNHCKPYRKRCKSSAAELSTLGEETGQSRDHKSQEDDHVLLDTISATLHFSANVSNKDNTVLNFVFCTTRHIILICWALYLH